MMKSDLDPTKGRAYRALIHSWILRWLESAATTTGLSLDVAWATVRLAEIKAFEEAAEGVPLVVALLGGTGTGKSKLVSAIFRQLDLCPSSVRRPCTLRPQAVHHSNFNPGALLPRTEPAIAFHGIDHSLLENLIVVDCPDFDGNASSEKSAGSGGDPEARRRSLNAVLAVSDVIIVVVTKEKYWDEALWINLEKYLRDGRALVVVETHRDRRSLEDSVEEAVRAGLRETGLEARLPLASHFVSVDSVAELKDGSGGVEVLRSVLRDEIAKSARRRIHLARTLESYCSLIDALCHDIEQRRVVAEAFRAAAREASLDLHTMWRRSILNRLSEVMPRLGAHFDQHISATMAGTLFGRFLEISAHSMWLFAIIPALRAQGLVRIAALGGAAGAAAIEKIRHEAATHTPWLEGIDLEPDPSARAIIFDKVSVAWDRVIGILPVTEENSLSLRADWETASANKSRNIGTSLEQEVRRGVSVAIANRTSQWRKTVVGIAFALVPAFGVAMLARSYFWDVPVSDKPALGLDFILLTCFITVIWGLVLKHLLLRNLLEIIKEAMEKVLSRHDSDIDPEAIFSRELDRVAPIINRASELSALQNSIQNIRALSIGSNSNSGEAKPAAKIEGKLSNSERAAILPDIQH